MTKEAVTPRALDQNTFAHIVPGDALPDGFERRVTAPKPAGHSAPGRVKPQRTSSTPPVVSWLFLLMAAAMALYARYLATQMVQNAVFHAVDSVKQIAGALTKLGDSGRAPSKPLDMARQTAPHPKAGASPPRKNTVVRASRWPFAN